jgi:hypothetical protein
MRASSIRRARKIGRSIADGFNQYAVKEIVDFNFNDVEAYPKLAFTGINKVDAAGTATIYQTLATFAERAYSPERSLNRALSRCSRPVPGYAT